MSKVVSQITRLSECSLLVLVVQGGRRFGVDEQLQFLDGKDCIRAYSRITVHLTLGQPHLQVHELNQRLVPTWLDAARSLLASTRRWNSSIASTRRWSSSIAGWLPEDGRTSSHRRGLCFG